MAALASVSFSNTFYTPLPSSSSQASSSLKSTQCPVNYHYRFKIPTLPIKGGAFTHAFSNSHKPILIPNGKQTRASILAPFSQDPLQDSYPKSHDEAVNEHVAGHSTSSKLMSVLQVYKEAVLIGDVKTTSEIEALICMVEKEKNQLAQKVSAMSMEINSGKEKYIRLQADFDNFRKRSERERLTVSRNAKGEVIESLLPMVDNFDRAKQLLKLETEREKNINASYQGIYKQLVEILKSLQVTVVPTVGKPFDPSIHESIAREESQEFKAGIIIQEVRRGFLLGERLLRPATVKVSSGPGKSKGAPTIPNNSLGQSAAASS